MSLNRDKIVERPGFTGNEEDHLKKAFDLFDLDGSGKIQVSELKTTMKNLGFDVNNENLFRLLEGLEKKNEGVDYETFKNTIADNLGQNTQDERSTHIYKQFIDNQSSADPELKTMTANSLTQMSQDLEENASPEEIKEIIKRVAANGHDITLEEFQEIMKRNSAN